MNTFIRKSRVKGESTISKVDSPIGYDISLDNFSVPSFSSQIINSKSSTLLYLQIEYAVFTQSLDQCNIGELIRQPDGVERNEWIANNIVQFFNHINVLYTGICHLCTTSTCPIMTGPQNSSYNWIDEKGKKVKCSAPQYIDFAMTFIQRTLANETIFPTRLDNKFPSTFEMLIRKMVRLLFHCLAHFYAIHYRQLIEYELNPHLNSLFLHFISFLIKSDIIPSENCNSNSNSNINLTISNQTETRELRSELESLSILYELLAKQWQHAYAQSNAQKRKVTNS